MSSSISSRCRQTAAAPGCSLMLVMERSSGLTGGQSAASDVKQNRKGSSGRRQKPRATLIELSVGPKSSSPSLDAHPATYVGKDMKIVRSSKLVNRNDA